MTHARPLRTPSPTKASEKAIAALLSKNKRFIFAELDAVVTPAGTDNDPYFPNVWHLARIGAPAAWDTSPDIS